MTTLRWENYFLCKNDNYHKFWEEYLKKDRNILFVLGRGFDPRMCLCAESILNKNGKGTRDFVVIHFAEGENSPSGDYQQEVENNFQQLTDSVNRRGGQIIPKNIQMENEDGSRIGSREAVDIFKTYSDFQSYTDIIVDISSMPFSIYIPLIGKILLILDREKASGNKTVPNLHITVAENPTIDKSIRKSGLHDEATYLYGFTGDLETVSSEEAPTVWIPILGEEQDVQIELISSLVSPKEICPVLPFPSVNPRRGDDLLLDYRELLMEKLPIELRNIVYAAEQNPFELYRQIQKTIEHYRDALNPLGDCKFAISSLSSKLMSIGSFLVAYEESISNKKKVGIAYVETKGYSMKKGASNETNIQSCELFSMWISGKCYDA